MLTLQVTANPAGPRLAWTDTQPWDGAYVVERNSGGAFFLIGRTTATTFTDPATPSSPVSYRVARDGYSNVATLAPAQVGSWRLYQSGAKTDTFYRLIRTSDGGYATQGYTNALASGTFDALIAKLRADFSVAWALAVGGEAGTEIAWSMVELPGGGYWVVGETQSFASGTGTDLFLLSIAADGTLRRAQALGSAEGTWTSRHVLLDPSGRPVAVATVMRPDGTGEGMTVDPATGLMTCYEGLDVESAAFGATGVLYLAGMNIATKAPALARVLGGTVTAVSWQLPAGTTGRATHLAVLADGTLLVSGDVFSPTTAHDVWVAVCDGRTLQPLRQTRIGGPKNDQARSYAAYPIPEGGFLVAADTQSYPLSGGGYDAWLLRLNADLSVAAHLLADLGTPLQKSIDYLWSVLPPRAGEPYIAGGYTISGGFSGSILSVPASRLAPPTSPLGQVVAYPVAALPIATDQETIPPRDVPVQAGPVPLAVVGQGTV